MNGNRINYFEFISSNIDKDCTRALFRIYPKIDLDKINELIDSVECIGNLEKRFYKTMIKERKERILEYSINLLKK